MNKKYNPFKPNQPVFSGIFAGRTKEIERIDTLLYQTKLENPSHIMILGERGIGKTSLLFVANHFAKGTLSWEQDRYNFLTLQLNINASTTLYDFSKMLCSHIKRELGKSEKGLAFVKNAWEFIAKIEVAGVGYKQQPNGCNQEEFIDNTIFSIIDSVKALTEDTAVSELGLRNKKDGIVILLDEVDSASKELNLGAFLKTLTEALVRENANKVLFILSGLPKTREILSESHESSLRLFEELKLTTLSEDEVKLVIDRGLEEALKQDCKITIDDKAKRTIWVYSEGYPHFVQQIGYSAYEIDQDNNIDEKDVKVGMFSSKGALDSIGDRYYSKMYYEQLKEDAYRQILNIMSSLKANKWIQKKEIKKYFKGKETTLTNGIKALRDRNIILSKRGSKGFYRLQWIGFAVWIDKIAQKNKFKNKQG